MSMRVIKPCKHQRPHHPRLPRSGTQPFVMLQRLADTAPGEWVSIDSFEENMGNPAHAKRSLYCLGWDVETLEKESDRDLRATDGYYRLTRAHHARAVEMLDAWFARREAGA